MFANESARAHVVIPKDLLAAIDQIVGSRKRSDFLVEALTEKVARERLTRALEKTAGVLDSSKHPEWATPEQTSAWVRQQRVADDEATERKLRGRQRA